MNNKICIIGLGYVGLPLSVAFAAKGYKVKGFDIAQWRIDELVSGVDRTLEVEFDDLNSVTSGEDPNLMFTNDIEDIRECNIYIVTVPTPIDEYKNPDLTPLIKASETAGKVLSNGDIVIYESTVYPGCTEHNCAPILEKVSNLKFNTDFFCGYSPERVNPGDKNKPLTTIKKVVSGSTPEIAETVDELYKSIISAGTHRTSSIKVAEAAKVIENTQRDLNIALMNELALIFDRMDINTSEVIEAAATKWNFLKFSPGLVGGHCIGVDPYYLTFKSQSIGYNPDMIISGRRVNDSMGKFIAEKTTKEMIKAGSRIKGSNVLIAGFTFKEDCPDVRNTKIIDIYNELIEYGMNIDVFDPVADSEAALKEYGINIMTELCGTQYDAIVITVKHKSFYEIFTVDKLKDLYKGAGILIDVKSILKKGDLPDDIAYWCL